MFGAVKSLFARTLGEILLSALRMAYRSNTTPATLILALPFALLLSPYIVVKHYLVVYKTQRENAKCREQHMFPPVPVTRKDVLERRSVGEGLEVNLQHDSRFFDLPAEIRDMVYVVVVGREWAVRPSNEVVMAKRWVQEHQVSEGTTGEVIKKHTGALSLLLTSKRM